MKKSLSTQVTILIVLMLSLSFLCACSNDNEDNNSANTINQTLTESDKNALLFMLEEDRYCSI